MFYGEKRLFRRRGEPAAFCDVCKGEVYSGDLVHVIDGFVVCPECFFDFIFDRYSGCLVLGSEINKGERT